MLHKFKVGDKVWVNEAKMDLTPLPHSWYGTIIEICDNHIKVRDESDSGYKGDVFTRFHTCLELRELIDVPAQPVEPTQAIQMGTLLHEKMATGGDDE